MVVTLFEVYKRSEREMFGVVEEINKRKMFFRFCNVGRNRASDFNDGLSKKPANFKLLNSDYKSIVICFQSFKIIWLTTSSSWQRKLFCAFRVFSEKFLEKGLEPTTTTQTRWKVLRVFATN